MTRSRDSGSHEIWFRLCRVRIVEGEVKNFKAMPPHGKIYEQFTVGEKTFFYSTYEITPGYSKTRIRGGLITDGLLVKVWYNGNTILKLSIRN